MAEAIALQVQQPDAFKSIGSMLGLANQAQNIQRGNIDLQQNEIKLQERKGIQDLLSDPRKFQKSDGTPDYDKIIFDVTKVAPTTGPEFIPKIIQGFKDSAAAQQSLNTLNADQRKQVGEFSLSIAGLPPAEGIRRLDGLGQQSPNLVPFINAAKMHLGAAANDPAKYKSTAMNIAQSVMSVPQQLEAMTPSGPQVSTGAFNYGINTKPMAGEVGSIIPGTIAEQAVPPTQKEQIVKGPDGNDYVVTKAPNGSYVLTKPLANVGQPAAGQPGSPAPGQTQPSTGAPATLPFVSPEDAASRGPLEAQRNAMRDAFVKQTDLRQNVRGVLDEIDKVSNTGTLGPWMQKINSAIGASDFANAGLKALDFTTPERKASSYDLVGKYLERIAIDQAQGMGPHTNAGLESAKVASGSVGYNPTAIKKLAKLIDANAAGVQAYQPGLEKAIDSHPQKSVLAKRDFDQAWGSNYDPRIMLIQNATQAGDKSAIEEIIKSVGGRNSSGARELIQKARNIEALTTTGRLP